MRIVWSENAWVEYLYWQGEDKKTLHRINDLIRDIEQNGYRCKGKPEALKGNLSGYFSVRIDTKNRLVFKIEGDQLLIIQCKTHYGI